MNSMFTSLEAFKATVFTKTFLVGLVLAVYGVYHFFAVATLPPTDQMICITNVLVGIGMMAGRDALRSSTATSVAAAADLAKAFQSGTLTSDQITKDVGAITAPDSATK